MTEKLLNGFDKNNNATQNKAQSESIAPVDHVSKLNFVRNKLETYHATLFSDVRQRIYGMIDELERELDQQELHNREYCASVQSSVSHNSQTTIVASKTVPENGENPPNSTKVNHNATDSTERATMKSAKELPEKVFRIRESYLTVLKEVNHIKTIYHIFYVVFIIYFLFTIKMDYFVKGCFSFGLGTIKLGFGNIRYVFGVWLLQKAFVCSIYYAIKVWSKVRTKLNNERTLQSVWSFSCLLLYLSSQVIFLCTPVKTRLYLDLKCPIACALLLETVRMLMKMHGFVRTICGRVLQGKLKSEDNESAAFDGGIPQFQTYLYYLFAPTFVYRDNYPRTAFIRWKFAAARLLEVVATIFLFSYIYERNIRATFEDYGKAKIPSGAFVGQFFGMILPSITVFMGTNHLLLHSWVNFTGELLRFGDRVFYKDWWTAGNYDDYFRHWNVVVSDWFYEYIYKDFRTHIFRGSKTACALAVYLISAIFHEYVMGYSLQLFFPLMFVLVLTCAVPLIFITRHVSKNVGNTMIWFSITYGNGLMISLYAMEYFTSVNCPKESYDSWTDWLVPHLWSCKMIYGLV